jgi:prepilin-type N-terminal cleavage/methylation domain-containing protein
MKIWKPQCAALRSGFSLIEMIVVCIIIGLLLSIAVPTYLTIMPTTELKGDAKKITFALQRARQVSSSFNRPARVLLDCTTETLTFEGKTNPCRLDVQLSVYDSTGLVRRWVPVQAGKMDLSANFRFTFKNDAMIKRGQFDSYRGFFGGFESVAGVGPRTYGVGDRDGYASDSMVVVYIPSGEAITYNNVDLRLFTKRKETIPGWKLDIINSTGYVRLKENTTV